MRQTTPSAFDSVRARYLVAVWLMMVFHVPGSAFILDTLGREWRWYWLDIAYVYYSQLILAVVILASSVLLAKVSIRACIGRIPTFSEFKGGMKLTVFNFVFALAAIYALYYPLSFVAPWFVQWWYIEYPDFLYFESGTYPVLPNFLSLVSLCVIAPIVEEFAFRGIILPRWTRRWGLRPAIVLSSAVFAIVHVDPIGAFVFGISMCILYLRTQSLILPIVCHALYNFAVWLTELGYTIVLGPDHVYTLEEFQAEWPWGVICAVTSALWIVLYFRRSRDDVRWALPVA